MINRHKLQRLINGMYQGFFEPIYHWRYWPMELLYLPLTLYVFFVGSIKTGKLFYFAAANPGVPLGGFASDSKYAILQNIPSEFIPATIFISKDDPVDTLTDKLATAAISYPLFVKPDIGEGGFLARKINHKEELISYHLDHYMDYLVQEFIDYPVELSILVHNAEGPLAISSITERKYLTVLGDGFSAMDRLLKTNKKAKHRLVNIIKQYHGDLQLVPKKDEICYPVPLGNWDYGATYIERTEIGNECLLMTLNNINEKLGLFNYGRYDIKCRSIGELLEGKMKILEINGVKGEPIHIYDTRYSLWRAYQQILRHWGYIMTISRRNLDKGVACPGSIKGFKMLYQHVQTKRRSLLKRINHA